MWPRVGIDRRSGFRTDGDAEPTNRIWQSADDAPTPFVVATVILFLLGIANFTGHKAVLESGHPMLARMAWLRSGPIGPPSLALEFVALVAAMLFTADGYPALVWIYAIYTAFNLASAWLLLSGRV